MSTNSSAKSSATKSASKSSTSKSSTGKGKDPLSAFEVYGKEAVTAFEKYFESGDSDSFAEGVYNALTSLEVDVDTVSLDDLVPTEAIEGAVTNNSAKNFVSLTNAFIEEVAEELEKPASSAKKPASSAKKPAKKSVTETTTSKAPAKKTVTETTTSKAPAKKTVTQPRAQEAGSEISEKIQSVDFLVRLLNILRNHEKVGEKKSFVEVVVKFINDYAPLSIKDQLSKTVLAGLRPTFNDAQFSKQIIIIAMAIMALAKNEDPENWFGTMDAHIFIHEPSLQPLMEEAKSGKPKKERNAVHFSVICAGTPPSKKTLARHNLTKEQIDQAVAIFYSFYYVKPIQAKRIGSAIVELEKDAAFLNKILENYNEDYALGWKGKTIFGTPVDLYVNKKSVATVKSFCDRYIHSGSSNIIRARGMAKVKNPVPLTSQVRQAKGPAPNSINPSVFLEPVRTWINSEKFPEGLFEEMSKGAVDAVGKEKYRKIKEVVSGLFQIPTSDTLAQMGFAYVATMKNLLSIPLYEQTENTLRMTAKGGFNFNATKALKNLIDSEIEFGLDGEGRRIKGNPASIAEISVVSAQKSHADKLSKQKVSMASQIHRDSEGNIRGINSESLAIKDLDRITSLAARPFRYFEDDQEVNELADVEKSIFLKKKVIVDGVETDTANLEVDEVFRRELTAALNAELAAAKEYKIVAAEHNDLNKKFLLEEREKSLKEKSKQ